MTTPAEHTDPIGRDRARAPTVVVDLDGTLIRGDLLWEGIRLLLRDRPFALLGRAPVWLLRGKAGFKAALADRVQPDAATLPYREVVLEHVRAARRDGARVVLASASPRPWVEAVASHVGIFDEVMASSPDHNLAGDRKLEAIRAGTDGAPFEYLGNGAVDLPIWRAADQATAVAPDAAARRGLAGISGHRELADPARPAWRAAMRQLRPHQWAKNALVFAPILLAHELGDLARLASTCAAFVAFCAVASAGYVLNDLVDVDADRAHPTKRRRPIAAGELPIPGAFGLLAALLVGAGAVCALGLSPAAAAMVLVYLALTLSYSFYFKQQLLLDVLLLAGLYTHRVLAGGVAARVEVSPWLLAFSTFFFLSLALAKRFVEFSDPAADPDASVPSRRAYQPGDLGLIEALGLSCACISVLILCLFVSSDRVVVLYRNPDWLWAMCPVMFYWLARIWLLAHRGELHDDPVLFATTDRNSYVAGLIVAAVVVAAAW
jgi:4-hydroxybenzoate polyprenyltransferase/phosphoserine phosphatase